MSLFTFPSLSIMAESLTNHITYFLFIFFCLFCLSSAQNHIGVNYGTLGDNLPPPAEVARFLTDRTIIDRVKIFDASPDIVKGFRGTPIAVTVTIANGDIPSLTQLPAARSWVDTHVAPFHPETKINRILMGNEILHTLDQNLIDSLVPAMKTLHAALLQAGLKDVQVTTAHSLGILLRSEPPSTGRFRPGWDVGVLAPMLQFHKETKSPFMVNPYPYFAYSPKLEKFTLFKPNRGRLDRYTNITYTNMLDSQLDAVYSSMKKLGYGDVDIVLGETGWPSVAEPGQLGVSLDAAASYNGNMVKHVNSGKGTPLMPGRKFETFIFGLFNENQKPGPIAERNFGLFWPNFMPVYNAGILRNQQSPEAAPSVPPTTAVSPPTATPKPSPTAKPTPSPTAKPTPSPTTTPTVSPKPSPTSTPTKAPSPVSNLPSGSPTPTTPPTSNSPPDHPSAAGHSSALGSFSRVGVAGSILAGTFVAVVLF